MPNVVIYMRKDDWVALERAGEEPDKWLRGMIKELMRKKREKLAEERT